MSLCLAIMSYPGGADATHRHFPYYEKAVADEIIGIGTTDEKTWFPKGVKTFSIGENRYIDGDHLPIRLVRTLLMLQAMRHDWFAVIEYDTLFLQPIARDLPLGLTTHLAGGKPAGCRCNAYYHNPWIMDRDTAANIVEIGYQIIHEGIADSSPDCFLGQVVERGEIPVHTGILKSYSQNTIHGDVWIQEARDSIANGAVAVHGIKDAETLRRITQ